MRLTLPDIDVAVTLTFSIGRLSVLVTRPRITSACARRPGAARKTRAAAPTAARTRRMSRLANGKGEPDNGGRPAKNNAPDWTAGPSGWFPATWGLSEESANWPPGRRCPAL